MTGPRDWAMTAARDHEDSPIIGLWKLGSEEPMLGVVPNLPTRIVTKGLTCMGPLCLAILTAFLLLAGSASADVTGSGAEQATEAASASPEASPVAQVSEQATEAAPTVPAPSTTPEVSPVPQVTEPPAEAVASVPVAGPAPQAPA